MGTVTQTRKLPAEHLSVSYENGHQISRYETLGSPSQSTTSFRTGKHTDGVYVDPDGALFSGGNSGSTFKKLKGVSITTDQGRSSFDTGHSFTTERSWVSNLSKVREFGNFYGTSYVYDGYIYPIKDGGYPAVPSFQSDYYGTAAIARTKPTNPCVNLALTLAELKKEGFPRLSQFGSDFTSGRSYTDSVGNGYLAWEFGFKPLGSEIGKLAATILDSKRILDQYRRDSGRIVRRKMDFPHLTSTERYDQPYFSLDSIAVDVPTTAIWDIIRHPDSSSYAVWTGARTSTVTTTSQRVWFSGAYQYYLPVPDSVAGRIERAASEAQKLLGIRVTPEVLWNLAPWSWLSDWNVNIGEILSNLESFSTDGLSLKYGYLMRTTLVSKTVVATGPVTRQGNSGPWTATYNVQRKERVRANPYGFGSDPASYTDRQWSILGALGMTKAPRTLG